MQQAMPRHKDWSWTATVSQPPVEGMLGAPPFGGGCGQGPLHLLAPAVPTTELVIPDWLHVLMLGTLQAVAAVAADPGCPQGWGLAGCLPGPYLLHPADLSGLQPVCTATTESVHIRQAIKQSMVCIVNDKPVCSGEAKLHLRTHSR